MKYNPKIVLAYFQECGLPKPVLEYRFHPDRKWRFDFAWPELSQYRRTRVDLRPTQLALEVQGGVWTGGAHVRGGQLRKEHEKRNVAASLGWRILYVFPEDLCRQTTVSLIKDALHL